MRNFISFNQNKIKGQRAFTLIEMLVVITIIGILVTLALINYGPAQRQAENLQRKSDLKQYQTALENFGNTNNSLFPMHSSTVSVASYLCSDLDLADCPEDPKFIKDSSYYYAYQSDGSSSDGTAGATQYVMWTKLDGTTNYWVVCSIGKSGTHEQAGFSVSGGECPL